ncbi:MAG: GIY-YIG nuclease family protein [Candidatus Omnitrophota bacterium]|nr:GIY-YIG nuclease family protein [Candidatus Omnitrophota bacterium]
MFVYVLRSEKDKSFYIGSTKNVEQRFNGHNRGQSLSTKLKRPWVLARVEEYESDSLALKREKFLKSAKGRGIVRNLCSFR